MSKNKCYTLGTVKQTNQAYKAKGRMNMTLTEKMEKILTNKEATDLANKYLANGYSLIEAADMVCFIFFNIK